MKISDRERREVVKRLQNGGVARDSEEAYVLLLSRVGIRPQLPAASTYEDAMVRIADLIDRPTTTRNGRFKAKHGRETPCCEVCGYSIGDMRWNYCPKCGATIEEAAK